MFQFLPRYNVEVEWEDGSTAFDIGASGRLRYADGTTVEIERLSKRSEYRVTNGPYAVGWTEYFAKGEKPPGKPVDFGEFIERFRPK